MGLGEESIVGVQDIPVSLKKIFWAFVKNNIKLQSKGK